LNPEENMTSLSFRDESATRRDYLRELSGRSFDTTYIANEISYHTKFLAAIDKSLLPSARTPELKQLLTTIRPAVAAHLALAQQIQSELSGR
jgi:putative membrane protein